MARRPSILKHSTAVITNTAACQYILHPANIYMSQTTGYYIPHTANTYIPHHKILYSPHSEYIYPTPQDIIFSTQRIHISHTPRYYILHTANTYIPSNAALGPTVHPSPARPFGLREVSLVTRPLGLPSTLLQRGPSAYARYP